MFFVNLPVKILKALLTSSILATSPAYLVSRFNHPDYTSERYKLLHTEIRYYKYTEKIMRIPYDLGSYVQLMSFR